MRFSHTHTQAFACVATKRLVFLIFHKSFPPVAQPNKDEMKFSVLFQATQRMGMPHANAKLDVV